MEEDDEDGTVDAVADINDVDASSHFLHYMENSAQDPNQMDERGATTPTKNTLNNNYIHVIHTNGVC